MNCDRNIYNDIEDMVKDIPEPMRTHLSKLGSVLRDRKHLDKCEFFKRHSDPEERYKSF